MTLSDRRPTVLVHRLRCSRSTPKLLRTQTQRTSVLLAVVLLALSSSGTGLASNAVGDATRQSESPVDPANPALLAGLVGSHLVPGRCNVPTDAPHSPLFGAKSFTQRLLRLEEFSNRPLESGKEYAQCKQDDFPKQEGYCVGMPEPTLGEESKGGVYTAYGYPDGQTLDRMMDQPLYPFPTRERDDHYPNPWEAAIEAEHTGPLQPLVSTSEYSTFADGRPPGPQFAHQRWEEFYPRVYSQTAQAGVRTNNGFRDDTQHHRYKAGEWGPGGLYHNTVHGIKATECRRSSIETATKAENKAACLATANKEIAGGYDKMCTWDNETETCEGTFDGTTAGIRGKFHPLFPEQDPHSIFTFDGTFPPKLQMARYMEGVLFRHHNTLPIKFEANRGFGNHFITTHHHNGHIPAESDGFAQAFFLPGQYYDYHWPMILAGHDPIEGNKHNNPNASEKRASTPCDETAGEQILVSYPSPLHDSTGKSCSYAEKLAENASRLPEAETYADEQACGWRAVAETCDAHGRIQIPGDWRETMSSLWFHDHMLDYTAQNTYKGNAALMNYYSGIDPGREGWKCHYENPEKNVNLCLPSGTELKWGNRDYDVNIVLAGKAWGQDTRAYKGTTAPGNPAGKAPVEGVIEGQLWFNAFNTDGFLGDRMTVNWLYDPYIDVRARRYRFRILNAHVSRFLRLALVIQRDHAKGDVPGEFEGKSPGVSYDRVPFHLIANDGNIMQHSVAFDGAKDLDGDGDVEEHHGILPTQSIAERYDIIVDFSEDNPAGIKPGDKLYLVNLLEHKNGRRPHDSIDLDEVLSDKYAGSEPDEACDTVVGMNLEFRVHSCTQPNGEPAASCQVGDGALASQQDRSMDPALYVEGNSNGPGGSSLMMIENPFISPQELKDAHHRTFVFGRGAATDNEPITITEAQGTNSAAPTRTRKNVDDFTFEINGEAVNVGEAESIPYSVDPPWGIKTDDGKMLSENLHRVDAAPQLGDLEIWHIINGGGGWSHNVHIHFEEGRILERDDAPPPDWEKWARKDVYRVGRMDDSGSSVVVAIRFREFAGAFMEHCHNTQHEDHAMLLRWDIENPGQLKPFLTPEPQWNGCSYTESYSLETARTQRDGQERQSEEVGDWPKKIEFESANSIDAVLCAAGILAACDSGISSTTPVNDSSAAPDPQEISTDSSTNAEEESLIQDAKPRKKKRRGRKRGGRRGGSNSGRRNN